MNSEFDAIVVGSGIAGGWAAKELCQKGFKTLLLERGRYVEHGGPEYTDFLPPWQSRFYGLPPERLKVENPKLWEWGGSFINPDNPNWFVRDGDQPYSTPNGKPYQWVRSYNLGGRSLTWSRHSNRWAEFHFRVHKRGEEGVEWPIRYADLAPWYSHVERFVGISGSKEGLAAVPDGEFQPPFPLNCAEMRLKQAVESAFPGRKVFPARTANLTAPTEEQTALGRGPCQSRNFCSKGCHYGAYFSSLSATLPAAKGTGNLTIVTDAIVHSVIHDPQAKRATGVRVIDARNNAGREYLGRCIFLCAGAIPSTQILLLSRSETFPHGLGNRSGALGRYLMGPSVTATGIGTLQTDQDRYYYGRKPTGFLVSPYRNVGERGTGYRRSFDIQGFAWRPTWERAVSLAGIGAVAKEALRRPGPWKILMVACGEVLPRWKNNVMLHPTQLDRWGMPLMHIDFEYSDSDRNMSREAKEDIRRMLAVTGCTDIQLGDQGVPGAALSDMGTVVMGLDPATSVLNRWNQVHQVPNVFVTDGSCVPSCGDPGSPSLTLMALTARAAHYAGELRGEGRL
jgi:choline dehydrogenase-like flavoprotein